MAAPATPPATNMGDAWGSGSSSGVGSTQSTSFYREEETTPIQKTTAPGRLLATIFCVTAPATPPAAIDSADTNSMGGVWGSGSSSSAVGCTPSKRFYQDEETNRIFCLTAPSPTPRVAAVNSDANMGDVWGSGSSRGGTTESEGSYSDVEYSPAGQRLSESWMQPVKSLKTRNTDKPRLHCAECPTTFLYAKRLRRHVGAFHSGTRVKPCYNFKKRPLNKVYIKCNVCPSSFSEMHSLREHVRLIHPSHQRTYKKRGGMRSKEGVCSSENVVLEVVELEEEKEAEPPGIPQEDDKSKIQVWPQMIPHEETITCKLCKKIFLNHHALQKHMENPENHPVDSDEEDEAISMDNCGTEQNGGGGHFGEAVVGGGDV
jgi:hypothetical protein